MYFLSDDDFKKQLAHDIKWTKGQIKFCDDWIKRGRKELKNILEPKDIKLWKKLIESSEDAKQGHLKRLENWQQLYHERYGQQRSRLTVIQGGVRSLDVL